MAPVRLSPVFSAISRASFSVSKLLILIAIAKVVYHSIGNYRSTSSRFEYLLHRAMENLRDLKCERQTGIILFGLNGVDRLARDSEFAAETGRGPAEFAPELRTR